ncbi:hypothetical protein AFLA_011476 [Aspergillus flavus NRRL3357]|uniref:CCHC-type domain-containing protein n=2 Tax=Aspergillus subgen. Circumdati TaxID=2720871 RepID=A0AB74BUD3_ASPFL|nr:uncharacterized protein G4B84_007295 [Aspergillus flavus NRRL3357]KAJ1711043.1 hypothetical protein NYO67_6805 [Aspergillus flavus]KAF7621167.1 hypothetical protein AFLA_011476 [Aspergillus flavus NRRL3357]QMW31914.1 hypothetical protein G4B84_007295 [Aspergillus flavus NRRL3357]QMW43947.1 hypothetical protein G4B11_007317 [Aspergillus flavus]RMZ36812.1 hypothetical protein CA14_006531 [Aspergillus flavus]
MEASRVEWPTLRMADLNAPGNVTRNLQQRIRDHHQDSNDILQYAQDNQGSLPDEAVKVIERWRDLTQDLLDWMGAKQELHDITGDIKCDDYALTTETEPPRLERYVQACKTAPPPAYYQSSYSSGSSPPATPSNLAQDREIAVKMWDPYVASQYRCLTPADITSQAEKARKSTARRDGGATLASIQFVAAKHLRSGDLSLTLRSAQEADIARTHRRWVKIFESDSVIDLPLWGVVVHDMPLKWVGGLSTPAARQRVINDLLAANIFTWGGDVDVLHVRWLSSPAPGTESSAMVVEFTHPEAANCAIRHGTIWESKLLKTILYVRPPCIRRCFSCQQFGHLSSICLNESTCCFCAERHDTRDCPRRTEAGDRVHKCANCGGPHAAASKNCSYYAEQIKKVQDGTTYRQRYYRIPIYMQGLENSEDGASSSVTSRSCSDSAEHDSASSESERDLGEIPSEERPLSSLEGASRDARSVRRAASSKSQTKGARSTGPSETSCSDQSTNGPASTTTGLAETDAGLVGAVPILTGLTAPSITECREEVLVVTSSNTREPTPTSSPPTPVRTQNTSKASFDLPHPRRSTRLARQTEEANPVPQGKKRMIRSPLPRCEVGRGETYQQSTKVEPDEYSTLHETALANDPGSDSRQPKRRRSNRLAAAIKREI